MKKTILSLLVALMATTGAWADEQETIATNTSQTSYSGTNVTITVGVVGDEDGAIIYSGKPMIISTTNSANINSVVLKVGGYPGEAGSVTASSGSCEVSGSGSHNTYITVTGINATSVTINGGEDIQIEQVVVNYESSAPAGPTVSGLDLTWNNSTNTGTFTQPAYDVEVTTELWYKLSQTSDNSALADKTNVFLERTLNNSTWSTFCAPFNADIPTGWTVKELSSTAFNNSNGTLTLNFNDAESIVKGTPYLVMADVDGPTFEGVTQDWSTTHEVTATGGYVTFVPVLTPTTLTENDRTKLYLGGTNTLYYPSKDVTVKGFRAYFQLNGITAVT